VDWVQTKDMPAIGFTKALPAEKHNHFMKQSGLVDLSSRIESDHALKTSILKADRYHMEQSKTWGDVS
jgi:hypothetical protein